MRELESTRVIVTLYSFQSCFVGKMAVFDKTKTAGFDASVQRLHCRCLQDRCACCRQHHRRDDKKLPNKKELPDKKELLELHADAAHVEKELL